MLTWVDGRAIDMLTVADGRTVELSRSFIDQRRIERARISNLMHCDSSCSTLLDPVLSRSLGQGNTVSLGEIRVLRKAIQLGSTPEGARWRRKACGTISRPSCRRSIADVGVRATPSQRPRGTSSPIPGHWRADTVWPIRRVACTPACRAGPGRTRISEGPATYQPVNWGRSGGKSAAERVEGEDRSGGAYELAIGDHPEGTRDYAGDSRLVERIGPVLLLILRWKGSHLQHGVVTSIAAARASGDWRGNGETAARKATCGVETLTNPEVDTVATSTAASSASKDGSQSVDTILLRSGMAPSFSNVVIRGSPDGDRRDGLRRACFANSPVCRVKPAGSHIIRDWACDGTPKIPDNQYTTSIS